MFTASVMDLLMEHGIDFDGVIGVSAGAAFGCYCKSKQIGRVIRYIEALGYIAQQEKAGTPFVIWPETAITISAV